jgi:benzoyl-CoA reductase/2-hydroxyglutaryl-CoA dehydratase subunit BcrC/BadD/HgdB
MNWFKNIKNKAELEYNLNHSEELEKLLDNTDLHENSKNALRDAVKNIVTAELLLESNPLATQEDYDYLEDTKAKYREIKDSLIKE